MTSHKDIGRYWRHKRLRQRVIGTQERPRLCVHRSLNNLEAQIVDDTQGKVIMGLSTLHKDIKNKAKNVDKTQTATILGEILATRAKDKGIVKVCFDRGGYMYHGRIKAFAEAARKAGLEF